MTTKQRTKGLYALLLQANPDLVPAGRNRVWLKPVGPVGRLIHSGWIVLNEIRKIGYVSTTIKPGSLR